VRAASLQHDKFVPPGVCGQQLPGKAAHPGWTEHDAGDVEPQHATNTPVGAGQQLPLKPLHLGWAEHFADGGVGVVCGVGVGGLGVGGLGVGGVGVGVDGVGVGGDGGGVGAGSGPM